MSNVSKNAVRFESKAFDLAKQKGTKEYNKITINLNSKRKNTNHSKSHTIRLLASKSK